MRTQFDELMAKVEQATTPAAVARTRGVGLIADSESTSLGISTEASAFLGRLSKSAFADEEDSKYKPFSPTNK